MYQAKSDSSFDNQRIVVRQKSQRVTMSQTPGHYIDTDVMLLRSVEIEWPCSDCGRFRSYFLHFPRVCLHGKSADSQPSNQPTPPPKL